MRLIRLTTEDDNGQFDCTFNEDIVLKPNSKLALSNLSIKRNSPSVTVDARNNQLEYSIGGDNKKVLLKSGETYDKTNYPALLSDVTVQMNGALNGIPASDRNRELGCQWKAEVRDNKVQIGYLQSILFDILKEARFTQNQLAFNGANLVGGQGADTAGGQYLYQATPFIQGSGYFQAQFANLLPQATGATTGVIVGLVDKAKLLTRPGKIVASDYLTAVTATGVDTNYGVLLNGTSAPALATEKPQIPSKGTVAGSGQFNDTLVIERNLGKEIVVKVYRSGVSPITLFKGQLADVSAELYPCITFFDKNDVTRLGFVRATFDPYLVPPISAVEAESDQPAVAPETKLVYGSTVGASKGDDTVTHAYNSYATAGATTNADYVDGSFPAWAASATLPSNYEDYTAYNPTLNVVVPLRRSYDFKEIKQDVTGLAANVAHTLTVVVSELDEQPVFTDATQTVKILEDCKVYINGTEAGRITAVAGGGESQTVSGEFSGIADTAGKITVEVSLQFVWVVGQDPDPTQQQGARMESINAAVTGGLGDYPKPPSKTQQDHTLTFPDKSLADFLGYDELSYTLLKQTTSVTFQADQAFDPTDVADSLIFELLDVPLDSYDSLTAGRRSILAVIPEPELADGSMSYESSNPVFVDVRNSSAMTLRNVRARVLKANLQPVVTGGTCVATLLVTD